MVCPYTDGKCGKHTQCKSCSLENIATEWGNSFAEVLQCAEPLNMEFNDFLDKCSACGGNWHAMILSGIKSLRPKLYEAIPDNMGKQAWLTLSDTLLYLGVYTED